MRKTMHCKTCKTNMKRIYVKIGSQLTGVAWLCPNYPNRAEFFHQQADEFDWYRCARLKMEDGTLRNLRMSKQRTHWDENRSSSCFGTLRRAYMRTKSSWRTVGWFCTSCHKILVDNDYEQELRDLRRKELAALGVE